MWKIGTTAWALCATLLATAQAGPPRTPVACTVLTWNIRYDNSGDSLDRWDQRKEALAQAVLAERPQIIGLQEALAHQLDFLKAQWPGYACFGVGREDGIAKGEFSPILYDTTAFELLSGRTVWLSETPDRPGKGWDAACERIATCVVVRQRSTDDSIWVVNTHWDHIGQVARKHSAEIIKGLVAAPLARGKRVLFMGDLNATPDDSPIHSLATILEDSCPPKRSNEGTFNGFDMTRPPPRRIDYIWHSPSNWRVVRYELPHAMVDGRADSDHFPVVVTLIPTADNMRPSQGSPQNVPLR